MLGQLTTNFHSRLQNLPCWIVQKEKITFLTLNETIQLKVLQESKWGRQTLSHSAKVHSITHGWSQALKLITGVSYLLALFSSMPASVSPHGDLPGASDLHETIFKDNRKKFCCLKVPSKIWESNIFGKSLNELVNEGLRNKLYHMPTDARMKFQETLERVINEGCNGLLCIIL